MAEAPQSNTDRFNAAVRGDPSAIEGGAHLLASYRWQVEGQRDILVHESSSLLVLSALAASVTGIMLQIARVIQ